MKKHSMSIAILLSTSFSPHLFSTNLHDEQKEGSYFTQPNNQVEQPKKVYDYTIVNHKNINHTLEDIEELDDDLESDIFTVNAKLITTNNQSTPLLLGAVLQHNQTNKHYQYLIADTGLLSKSTQLNAVKRAHRKGFHLIKATRGHVSLQLLEWLQISKHYSVTALHTNRPVCRNCYLIAHSLWKKKLQTNEKGCVGVTFPLLDKIPTLAQQYINTHLNFTLVQSLVVPMMGYVSKEEIQKAIQQKDKQLKEKDIKHQQELKKKNRQIDEKNDHIQMLNKEVNKKDNQLNDKNKTISSLNNQVKEKDQMIADFQSIMPIEGRYENEMTPFLHAAKKGKLGIAKLLKERGANLNAKNKSGNNALHLACLFSGSADMVDWLLDECKMGLEIKDREQKTPFFCAVYKGHLAIAKLLKERGANIHATNEWKNNALHMACLYSGSVEMLTWLLDVCKIDIDIKGGFYKMTPFLCAAYNGQLEIAKLLKEQGANIYAKDKDGNNALWYAKKYKHQEMISYLQSLGLT